MDGEGGGPLTFLSPLPRGGEVKRQENVNIIGMMRGVLTDFNDPDQRSVHQS